MPERLIAKIAVDKAVYSFDQPYSYVVPGFLEQYILKGCRVLIPFGISNNKRQGMVLDVIKGEPDGKLKEIIAVLDQAPLLSDGMISLVYWLKERYYCTLYDAIKLLLPSGINMKIDVLYEMCYVSNEKSGEAVSVEEEQIIRVLSESRKALDKKEICKRLGFDFNDRSFHKLIELGFIKKTEVVSQKIKDASIKLVRIKEEYKNSEDIKKIRLSPKQKEVYDFILCSGSISAKEVSYFTGVKSFVITALVKKGVAEFIEDKVYRNPYDGVSKDEVTENIVLTDEQENAYESLLWQYKSGKGSVGLLYGITGSGKTSVFMKLIDSVYSDDRGIIVMVPEISLTPQLIALFHRRYGSAVAVFHSGLSLGERLDEWKRVREKKAKIVIGTRSAVFAPFENIGLIIMDEEQEYTYKSDASPRFHARDVAKFRCNYHDALLLLSSATPSVQSYYSAACGKYTLNVLKNRYGEAKLPEVLVVDMGQELMQGNDSAFSSVLIENIRRNIDRGKQSILLLNRRGYNTFITCRSCGEVFVCPHCSISMTYHSANGRLMCHYCGYSVEFSNECPNCHEENMRCMGLGTQRAEQDLKQLVPDAKILRMDTDATLSKFSYEKKLKQFSNGEYNVMIGTQMVAKGLDFPNVTLVGVLSADQSLYNNDFRSYERAFALLTQVVGRSGRGDVPGKAIIQTLTPDNFIIKLAASQDYVEFYSDEIKMRKAMLYPPFADICVVGFIGLDEKKTKSASNRFFSMLRNVIIDKYSDLPVRILGPSVASVPKINNKFRYKIIIKFRNSKRFRDMMSGILRCYGNDHANKGVVAFIDINPDIIM